MGRHFGEVLKMGGCLTSYLRVVSFWRSRFFGYYLRYSYFDSLLETFASASIIQH